MNKLREKLAGKKAYLVCAAAVLGAVIAWGSGEIELFPALQLIVTSIIGVTLRAGIAKTNPN